MGPEAPQTENPITIRAQYIKDFSFEAPSAPGVLLDMQKTQPDISINIDVKVESAEESKFEVILQIKAKCIVGEKVGFILELVYGGLFDIKVPAEHMQAVLLIECPRLLFPFARNVLANATRDGGFPPLMLDPVDFAGMFRNQMEAAQKNGGEAPDKPAPKVN
ncbi:MAG: protein-export chaperone SecB [Rhodospirillales bacterium]